MFISAYVSFCHGDYKILNGGDCSHNAKNVTYRFNSMFSSLTYQEELLKAIACVVTACR